MKWFIIVLIIVNFVCVSGDCNWNAKLAWSLVLILHSQATLSLPMGRFGQ